MEPVRALRRALRAPIDDVRTPRHVSLPGVLDFRSAVRATCASPVVSITSVLALGVGIALATAAFTVVHAIVYSDFPVPGGDRLLVLKDYDRVGRWRLAVTLEEHERRRRALSSYVDVAAYRDRQGDVTFEGAHDIRWATSVTPNVFSVIGVMPIHGRAFDMKDAEPGATPVALINERVARRAGLLPSEAVGRRLQVHGERYDVIGIIPETCRFPSTTDIWVPLMRDRSATGAAGPGVTVVARARPDLNLAAATAELRVIASQVPPNPREHRDQEVESFATVVSDDDGAMVGWAIVGTLVLLLLVAAGNVANLLLARSAARQRDLAIRTALGASRGRIVASIAIEAALLAAIAAGLGLVGTRGALAAFRGAVDDVPYWITLDLDWRVFFFAVGVAALASVVAGVGPALKVTRGSFVDTLRIGHATVHFGRVSALITIAEAAIAVALLSGAASFAQSLIGFNFHAYPLPEDRVAIAQIDFPLPPDLNRHVLAQDHEAALKLTAAFFRRVEQHRRELESQVSAIPGVRAVAYAWHFPGDDRFSLPFEIQGVPVTAGTETRYAWIGHGFFALMGAGVLAGRDFTRDDVDQERPVAIVNEPFARKYFGEVSPVGRRVRIGRNERGERRNERAEMWLEIVGVVPDLGLNPRDPSRADGVYVPLPSKFSTVRLAWLTDGHPLALAPAVHEAVRRLPIEARVQYSRTLADNLTKSASIFRGIGYGLVVLGVLTLVMTCTAIHAIVAFSLAQRRRELAIRVALGAGASAVLRALLGRTARQLAAGALLGALLALAISRLIDDVLPMDVPTSGVWRPAGTMALIMIAGLSACAGPLRRALRLRPLDWLREG